MYKRVMILIALLPSLALSFVELPVSVAEAVQLRDGKNYFVNLPTFLEAESTVNYVYSRNATYYFGIALPQNMGANLQKVEIVQTEGFETLDFRIDETIAYFQPESGDRVAIAGKAEIEQNQNQQKKIVVTFDPPIPAAAAQNRKLIIGLRPVRNPRYDGVYLFGVSASPDGDRPNTQFLGYGRLNFYDPRR